MFNQLLKFLTKYFKMVPPWVQVVTYLSFVGCVVLIVVVTSLNNSLLNLKQTPKYVWGKVLTKGPHGGMKDLPDVRIGLNDMGHDFYFISGLGGSWTVPILSQNQADIQIEVFHPDNQEIYPVCLKSKDIYKKGGNLFTIEITNDTPFVQLLMAQETRNNTLSDSKFAFYVNQIFHPSTAFAGELQLPEEIQNCSDCKLTSKQKASIKDTVIFTVSNLVSPQAPISWDTLQLVAPKVPYVVKVTILEDLGGKFGFTIPLEHWKSLNTVKDLINYVEKRQVILSYLKQTKGVSKIDGNWSDVQKSFPAGKGPKVVYH